MRWKSQTPILSKSELRTLERAAELLSVIEEKAANPWHDDAWIAGIALENLIVRATPKVTVLKEYRGRNRM